MTILENIDIGKAILENIDIGIDIEKDIFENINIDKDILEYIDIDIDMGMPENIDIDITIDRDILSEKLNSGKNRAFSCFNDEILISIVDISAFFEISTLFLKISIST